MDTPIPTPAPYTPIEDTWFTNYPRRCDGGAE